MIDELPVAARTAELIESINLTHDLLVKDPFVNNGLVTTDQTSYFVTQEWVGTADLADPHGAFMGWRKEHNLGGKPVETTVVLYYRDDPDGHIDVVPRRYDRDSRRMTVDEQALEQRPPEQLERMAENARNVRIAHAAGRLSVATELSGPQERVPRLFGPHIQDLRQRVGHALTALF